MKQCYRCKIEIIKINGIWYEVDTQIKHNCKEYSDRIEDLALNALLCNEEMVAQVEVKPLENIHLSSNSFAYSLKTQSLVHFQEVEENTICSCASCRHIVFAGKEGFFHPNNYECIDSIKDCFETAVLQALKEIKHLKILGNIEINQVTSVRFLKDIKCLLLDTAMGRMFVYIKITNEIPQELKLNAIAKFITMVVLDFTVDDNNFYDKDYKNMNMEDIKNFLQFSENQYFINNTYKIFSYRDYYLHFLYKLGLKSKPYIDDSVHGEDTFCIGSKDKCKHWILSALKNFPAKDIAFVQNKRIKLLTSNKDYWTLLENFSWEKKGFNYIVYNDEVKTESIYF